MTILMTTWSGVAIPIVVLTIIGLVILMAISQIFGTAKARMSIAREDAYQRLAEKATEAQELCPRPGAW